MRQKIAKSTKKNLTLETLSIDVNKMLTLDSDDLFELYGFEIVLTRLLKLCENLLNRTAFHIQTIHFLLNESYFGKFQEIFEYFEGRGTKKI